MKKMPSKVAQYCQPAQNQPKSYFLFHKNVSLRDFYIMTLATDNTLHSIVSCITRDTSPVDLCIMTLGLSFQFNESSSLDSTATKYELPVLIVQYYHHKKASP